MATGADVLTLLCPDVEWTISGDSYENIDWFGKNPAISKRQFEEGFVQADEAKEQAKVEAAVKRSAALAKLAALGLDEDDLKALGL